MDWICTQERRDHIEYEWTIKKFEELPQKINKFIESSVFPANNDNEQWILRLYPRGNASADSIWISLFLRAALDKMRGIKVKYQLSISRSKQLIQTRTTEDKYDDITAWGYNKFIERMKLIDSDDSDNTIIVYCKIDILGTYITSFPETSKDHVTSFESEVHRLDKDFCWLYNNLEFSDFTVISGDKSFPAHKTILASRSSVFAAMFKNKEMDENVRNEVKIENMRSDVVERMLEFIYKDYVTNIDELAGELLAAAEQYALEGLKHLCEKTLYKSLEIDNAVDILALADLHHADQLKKHVIKYTVDHYSAVIKSEGFKTTEVFSGLAKELLTALNSSTDENTGSSGS